MQRHELEGKAGDDSSKSPCVMVTIFLFRTFDTQKALNKDGSLAVYETLVNRFFR